MKVCAFHHNLQLLHLPKRVLAAHQAPKFPGTPRKPTPAEQRAAPPPLSIELRCKGAIPATRSKSQVPSEDLQAAETLRDSVPRWVFIGGASLALALLLLGSDGQHKALALGPEGPLVEEFWENVRRYALYMVTVSTGVIYTVLQPIVELLKSPVSAVLLIILLAGSGYLVSQVLSAMVGISDFSYDYDF